MNLLRILNYFAPYTASAGETTAALDEHLLDLLRIYKGETFNQKLTKNKISEPVE